MKPWQKKAMESLNGINVTPDFPMARLTSFKIGGPLDLLAEPENSDDLGRILRFCSEENQPWFILGLGSNLLVRDKGIRGVGVKLAGRFNEWRADGNLITAGAGVVLGDLSKATACMGLTGLEFACGIPGSVGGAVFMNAGAYDGEISQVLRKVQGYHPDRGLVWHTNEELSFSYRFSCFQENGEVVTQAVFRLSPADKTSAEAKITDLTCRREEKQPLELPSAGSVFRRPKGYYVGTMIEEAGLKGYRIGGAQVSPKHAGFIVNTGNATAKDVLDLIAHIQTVIREKYGVDLVPEVRVMGE